MSQELYQRLGVDFPLIQAPMAGAQDSAMACAVYAAGGMGSLPCALLSTDQMRDQLTRLQGCVGQCMNVNFFAHKMPVLSDDQWGAIYQNWQEMLRPFFGDFNQQPENVAQASLRRPFDDDSLAILQEFKPKMVSFHFGLPDAATLTEIKKWGGLIASSATTVEEAIWLEAHGADIVIAQGWEAGGHRGHFLSEDLALQMGIFALLPQIKQAVACPVVAAGGVAAPEHVAQLLKLGADMVQVGTSYLLCHESLISSLYRAALKMKNARHTAVTNIFSGWPARGIINEFMVEMGYMREDVPPFPLAGGLTGALKKVAEQNRSSEFSNLWAGQNTSACRESSAQDMTKWLVSHLTAKKHRKIL